MLGRWLRGWRTVLSHYRMSLTRLDLQTCPTLIPGTFVPKNVVTVVKGGANLLRSIWCSIDSFCIPRRACNFQSVEGRRCRLCPVKRGPHARPVVVLVAPTGGKLESPHHVTLTHTPLVVIYCDASPGFLPPITFLRRVVRCRDHPRFCRNRRCFDEGSASTRLASSARKPA